jgi:uncharacterized membrane protein YbhN (UPF0104 family)
MGHGDAQEAGRPSEAPSSGGVAWRQHVKRGVLLLVAAVSLYLLLPTLLSVFASWRSLSHLDWPFAVLVVACEAASYLCLWELDRIALGTSARFPIACAQLAGNAVGRIVPGAPTPFAVGMLHRAGFDTGKAAAALTASTGLQLATMATLPLLALPAIIGGAPISHGLASAAYLGVAMLLLLVAADAAAFAADRPLQLAGRGVQWLLNHTIRRHRHVDGLPRQLLADRDFIRTTLGGRWQAAVVAAAGNTGFDYLALLSRSGRSGPPPDRRWCCWPTPPRTCWRCCRSRPVAWALWRRGWSARSGWPVSPERTRRPRRFCTGWSPSGCPFPPAVSPTSCSAAATTDAMDQTRWPVPACPAWPGHETTLGGRVRGAQRWTGQGEGAIAQRRPPLFPLWL